MHNIKPFFNLINKQAVKQKLFEYIVESKQNKEWMNVVYFFNIYAININSQDNSQVFVNFGPNLSIGKLTTYKRNEGVVDNSSDTSTMTTTDN